MTDLLQPGNHPDAEQLSAFAEHALPPHEQQQTLAHLATCAACRNLVYLTQQAAPIELPQPAATPRPWFRIWGSAWNLTLPAAAALACLIFFTLHLRNPHTPAAPTTTASVEPPPPTTPSAPEPTLKPAAPISPQAPAPKPKPALVDKQSSPIVAPAPTLSAAAAAPPPPMPQTRAAVAGMTGTSFAPLSFRSQIMAASGAIDGRITDPSGAIVPRAKITATNTDTGVVITRESTPTGSFSIAPLQPGNYNVEAVATGFQRLLQQNVHVEPTQELALNMKLNVGADNQTVTVTNAPPSLDTTNATLGGTIENQLYSQLPLATAAQPKSPATVQRLRPSGQQAAATAPLPPQPAAPADAASVQTAISAAAQQGVYGGTGQTNLNQNYIEATPATSARSGGGGSGGSAANTGAAPATDTAAASDQVTLAVRRSTLPSHLPALSTVTIAHRTLSIDTAGALFRSEDAGVTWLPVTTQWQGRATRIALARPSAAINGLAKKSIATAAAPTPAATPPPLFELTTDTNVTYISTDGQTWRRK